MISEYLYSTVSYAELSNACDVLKKYCSIVIVGVGKIVVVNEWEERWSSNVDEPVVVDGTTESRGYHRGRDNGKGGGKIRIVVAEIGFVFVVLVV